jgi:hypothetical protein
MLDLSRKYKAIIVSEIRAESKAGLPSTLSPRSSPIRKPGVSTYDAPTDPTKCKQIQSCHRAEHPVTQHLLLALSHLSHADSYQLGRQEFAG